MNTRMKIMLLCIHYVMFDYPSGALLTRERPDRPTAHDSMSRRKRYSCWFFSACSREHAVTTVQRFFSRPRPYGSLTRFSFSRFLFVAIRTTGVRRRASRAQGRHVLTSPRGRTVSSDVTRDDRDTRKLVKAHTF